MQSFGPLILTANTLTQVSCSPASLLVYIGNDSPYDVLVSFSVSQPPLVTTAGGTGDWTAVVQAFHHATLPTPANMRTPQGSTFAGNVWLLPLDTRNTTLVNIGSVSTTANAWVIACLPGETPPDAYASPRQTDITSQSRVAALPPAPSNITSGSDFGLVPATNPTITMLNSAYRTDQLVPNTPIGSTFDKNIFYLYWLSISTSSTINGVLGWDATIQTVKHDASLGPLYRLFKLYMPAAGNWQMQLCAPISIAISNPDPGFSSTYLVNFRVFNNPYTANTIIEINFSWDLDLSNGIALPTPGGGQLQAAGLVVNNTRFRF